MTTEPTHEDTHDPDERVTALQRELTQLREQYDQSQQTISALERRQRIDALLTQADTIDLDTARLLTEIAVGEMEEPDLTSAVGELRRSKPYLFHLKSEHPGLGAHAPRQPEESGDVAGMAGQQAQQSGDRRDLLRYLRLRREG
ncbi:MAG: hypothetical protein AAGH88_00685 [Planctomycetota bacterium]